MSEVDFSERESRLLSVVQNYQSILENGGRPDRRTLLEEHADLAEMLPSYLDTLDALHAGDQALQRAFDAGRVILRNESFHIQGQQPHLAPVNRQVFYFCHLLHV